MTAESQTVTSYLKEIGALVEQKMHEHIPPETLRPERLHEAMRYSLFAGGKRLRPVLAYATWEMLNGQGEDIFYVTSALEMFHTFSLIHDDLPCMDDDDLRRGKPTAHKQFDEATAVLSGDALVILGFELLGKTKYPETISVAAKALGSQGMIGGQVVDIESEGKEVQLGTVQYIHMYKTAALLRASIVCGAIAAGADQKTIEIFGEYGNAIGLAFQIVDDILDIEQTTEQLGKDAGSDLERGKATYPALIGLEASKARAQELYEEAIASLDKLDVDTSIFKELANFIITRVN